MLFYCTWADVTSLLVDAVDKGKATEIAEKVGGSAPRLVQVVPPNTFASEVIENEEEEGAEMLLEPLEHSVLLLSTLEDNAENEAGPMREVDSIFCESTALDDEDAEVRCSLSRHHAGGKHKSADGLEWEDAQ